MCTVYTVRILKSVKSKSVILIWDYLVFFIKNLSNIEGLKSILSLYIIIKIWYISPGLKSKINLNIKIRFINKKYYLSYNFKNSIIKKAYQTRDGILEFSVHAVCHYCATLIILMTSDNYMKI